ncbi:MAG: hypothetical protein U0836_17920 [Pirellulales bacterium]
MPVIPVASAPTRRFQLVAIDPNGVEYILKPDVSEQEALAYFSNYDPANPVRVEAREIEPVLKPDGVVLQPRPRRWPVI